jgi:hypothetical protein
MIVSILTRTTRLYEPQAWQAALETVLPRIRDLMATEEGFISVQYMLAIDGGRMAQITTWASRQDCLRYIREGGAAMVATVEDAALPTAAHPHGSWTRETFDALDIPT